MKCKDPASQRTCALNVENGESFTSQSVAASRVSARTEWDCGPIRR